MYISHSSPASFPKTLKRKLGKNVGGGQNVRIEITKLCNNTIVNLKSWRDKRKRGRSKNILH